MASPAFSPLALLAGPPSIAYSGFVLDARSRQALAAAWQATQADFPGGPWTLVADHVTLCLGALPAALRAGLGTDHNFTADAVGANPAGTAVAVRVRGVHRTDGGVAHVTLALRGSGQAQESNDITQWTPLSAAVPLRGTLQQIPESDQTDPAQGVTRLVLLDFDGTLVDTPEPEEGKAAWAAHYGRPYPHEGWWGRPESLDPAIWPMKRVIQGYQVYRRERPNPQTRLVLLTNRIEKLAPLAEALLAKHGLRLDACTYRQGSETKAERVAVWLDALPGVTSVLVLDDHDSYLGPIRELAARYPHVKIETQLVDRHFRPTLRESLDRLARLLRP